MDETISIKTITALETHLVRHPVLRAGKPIDSCIFDGDFLDTTRHFGIFIDNELAGVISMFENRNANFSTPKQYQIRGMAVLESYQKRGLGGKLVQHVESEVKLLGGNLVWFNARDLAVPFYVKLGYQVSSEPFLAIGIVHFVMHKQLK